MSDSSFLDSNVLVYASEGEGADPKKTEMALALSKRKGATISTQVLGKFYRAVTGKRRKKPLSHLEAVGWIEIWKTLHVQLLTLSHIDLALENVARFQVSYYDALILAAAKMAGCAKLYTEDLSDGQDYDGVRVINPFLGIAHKK